jgi:glycosyltransferase involved in cell wall biosynthesis
MSAKPKIVAILATYNEERFIDACLENLCRQGLQVHLIDNGSADRTVAIAERFLGRGLLDIETLPRADTYDWQPILERKEQVAERLDADWFVHVDADEIRLPSPSHATLAEALADADAAGYNAVDFLEFTFVPTVESPDHDHPEFQRTMRWYYPFLPRPSHRINAWKRQPGRVELAWSAGHQVRFPGIRPSPAPCFMRHYIFLSLAHAGHKYIGRQYNAEEVRRGWHGRRASLTLDDIRLPSQHELRQYTTDRQLDPANPRTRHVFFETRDAATPR